jgi:hypothetical protein
MALSGLAIRLSVSMLCYRVLSSLLFGIKPTDVTSIGGVCIVDLRHIVGRQLRTGT